MRAFRAALAVGFHHVFIYRGEVVIQLFSAAIVAGLNAAIWAAATSGRDAVAGVPGEELRAYVIVAWAGATFFATRVNEEIGRRFREGQIVADLLRPMSLQAFWYARDLGRALACMMLQTLPLFVGCYLLFDFQLPTHPLTWGLWGLSLALAHMVNYGISFLIGIAAFRLHNIAGLTHLKGVLVSVLSGALIPLELFSPTWRPLIYALPFRAMAHIPASIYLERPGPVAELLGFQAAWALALWLMGMGAWRYATRQLTVQGG